MPPQLKKKKIKKGSILAYRKDDKMTTLAWQDKRQVVMLSTKHNKDTKTIDRRLAGGEVTTVEKPTVVLDYK